VYPVPPKKAVGMDVHFIEKRRRGLQRYANFIANHPVLHKDPTVVAFLTWNDVASTDVRISKATGRRMGQSPTPVKLAVRYRTTCMIV
jgi:PX domain